MALIATTIGLTAAGSARAGTITFANTVVDLNGTGFGNVLSLLVLHDNGSEHGSVGWDGTTDTTSGDATNQSDTQTAQTLAGEGVTDTFQLVFNIGESGSSPEITLFDFALRFYAPGGGRLRDVNNVELPDIVFDAPAEGLVLTDAGGTGQSGWRFDVVFSAHEATTFFANGANRIGMYIDLQFAIQNTSGAEENFFAIKLINDEPPPVATPEPATWLLAGLGAGGLAALALRRRSARSKHTESAATQMAL